jgi:hypothetical protein
VLTLPAEFAASLELQPLDALINTVAGMVGEPGDPDGRAAAMGYLQEAVDQLNAGGVLLFSRKELTVTDLVAGQSSFALPDDWGWPEQQSAYALNADGNQVQKLTWLPWEVYRDIGVVAASVPNYLSIMSDADQTAVICPPIDIGSVASLRIPYLTRIPDLASTTQLRLSPEARHALRSWGKAYAMQDTYKDKPPIYSPFFKLAENATRAAWGADCRRLGAEYAAFAPDEVGRLPGTNTQVPTGRVFIEI